jgi:hypothetical protein
MSIEYPVPFIIIYLHVSPDGVLFSAVRSKLCTKCQMHADPEPRFVEQMKAAVFYFALFTEPLWVFVK